MSDQPFLRGQNRLDWLFATVLQSACDFGGPDQAEEVVSALETGTASSVTDPNGVFPPVTVISTASYLFVVASSTRSALQWVGNVLGSAATSVPPAPGTVSAWFGAYALTAYQGVLPYLAESAGKTIVLIGFSLGAAAVTILKAMIKDDFGSDSACVAIASPRPGTPSFKDGFPADNFSSFVVVNDIVPSTPPETWAGTGLHNDWTPFPPFVSYVHVSDGNTVTLDGQINPGTYTVPASELVLGFDLGTWSKFHDPYLYARVLRTKDLPGTLPDNFMGYPKASTLDGLARIALRASDAEWPWPLPSEPATPKGTGMPTQATIYIRNIAAPDLGPREIYYFMGDDPVALLASFTSSPNNLLAYRANFLSKSCEIYAVRCNFVGSPRKSILKKLNPTIKGVTGVTEDIEASVVYFGWSGAFDVKRQFHFRGIDSNWITADKLTTAANTTLIESGGDFTTTGTLGFLNRMKAAGLAMHFQTVTIPNGHPVASIAKTGQDGLLVLTLGDTYSVPPNTRIQLSGFRGAPLLNGIWLSSGPATPGVITLAGSGKFSAPAGTTGVIRPAPGNFAAVQSFSLNGVGSKKTGRQSFLQRGRRSVLVRRR